MCRTFWWGQGACWVLLAVASGCGSAGEGAEPLQTLEQAAELSLCDGPEDLGATCGTYGRVCSATAQCVYPAACNSSATGPGVFRGDVTVDATDTAGDLAQLDGTWCVTGNLTVAGSTLPDLSALGGLVAVGNSLTVQQNANLTSLSGLEALQSAVSVKVVANQKLTSLTGLLGLKRLSSLEVVGNNQLTTLDGLAAVDVTSSVSLTGNGKLLEVRALSGIVGSMFGYLHVQNEASLADLSGLANVTSVGSSLRIFNSDALTSLHGLDGITRVGGELLVTLNDKLQSLQGLGALTQLGSAKIQTNPLLDECSVSELISRTAAPCTACTGQLACSGTGSECSVPACAGNACGSTPKPVGTPCAAGYCAANGVCAAPASVSVFNLSDGSIHNPPSTRNGVYSAGEVVSVATNVANYGPATFRTSDVRIVTTDPFVTSVSTYPIYTNQVLPGQSGNAYPRLRLDNDAPEGHVVSFLVEVDYTIDGVQRRASLAQSFTIGPPNAQPDVPVTLDVPSFEDGHYLNVHGRDGHYSPGEYINVNYFFRNWSDELVRIQSRQIQTSYTGASWISIGSSPSIAAGYGASGQEQIYLDPSAPLGQFAAVLEVRGTIGSEPFVATLPFSFDVTAP